MLEQMQEAVAQLQQGLAEVRNRQVQILAELEQTRAWQANAPRRRHNYVVKQFPDWELEPLVKEQPPPAGAAGAAAVGALPPANIFPQTWADLLKLTTAQLNELATFYGVQFGPGALAARREVFMAFIT